MRMKLTNNAIAGQRLARLPIGVVIRNRGYVLWKSNPNFPFRPSLSPVSAPRDRHVPCGRIP